MQNCNIIFTSYNKAQPLVGVTHSQWIITPTANERGDLKS